MRWEVPAKVVKQERRSEFLLPPPFVPGRPPSELDDAHPHWGGQSALLSTTQVLILSGNTLPDTPRNSLWPNTYTCADLVKLTLKINYHIPHTQASLLAQMVKNPHALQETGILALGQEDALEKGMATHSSILACKIPWTEEPGGRQSMCSQRIRHDLATKQQ